MTMFIAGLWHGASWNFVLWGLFHGISLTAERGMKLLKIKHKSKLYANRLKYSLKCETDKGPCELRLGPKKYAKISSSKA